MAVEEDGAGQAVAQRGHDWGAEGEVGNKVAWEAGAEEEGEEEEEEEEGDAGVSGGSGE